MRKYLTVFGMSFQNEFTYRLNFVLWRLRNVLRVLMVFVLWNSIFSVNQVAFGYSRGQMMAYVFLVLVVTAFVTSAPSNDTIGGEISSGDLSNYLVKPINYLNYWLTRDWASKLLNILFATAEVTILYLLLQPQITLTSSPSGILIGLALSISAAFIYFFVSKVAVMLAFWAPENTWGAMFTLLVLSEVLSGGIFPLDILPGWAYSLVQVTPFPYLTYFPIAALVGKISPFQAIIILLQSLAWAGFAWYLSSKVWAKGQKVYSASGR